jgi:hypothetical protein
MRRSLHGRPVREDNAAVRRFRLLLLLLLSLALPLYAAAPAAPTPCAMSHDAPADEAPAGCCNDADMQAATGQPCKTGQDCPAGALPLLHAPAVAHALPAERRVAPHHRPPPPALATADIWRPPTAS